MLDRQVVKEFLKEQLKYMRIKRPADIPEDVLVETFCKYTEDDYYEWLKDNFESFFNHGNTDWNRIREMVKNNSKQ